MEGKESRVLELVNELVGAQTTAKILTETWEALNPEVKQQIADAMAKRALALLDSDAVNWHIQNAIRSMKVELPEGTRERLAADVQAGIEKQWPKIVNNLVVRQLEAAVVEVEKQFKLPHHRLPPHLFTS